MPYAEIDFVSQSEVHYMKGQADTVVISIRNSNSDRARISPDFKDVLYLEFDNVEHLRPGVRRFCRDDAKAIIDFVAKHEDRASRIVVNCLMGESRSAAVAIFLSKKYKLPLTKSVEGFSDWVLHVLERTNALLLRDKAAA